jgi:hypothetical protein
LFSQSAAYQSSRCADREKSAEIFAMGAAQKGSEVIVKGNDYKTLLRISYSSFVSELIAMVSKFLSVRAVYFASTRR